MSNKKKKTKRGKFHEWLTSEGLIKPEGWARDGLTDEQIAENMAISPSTLYEWKKKYYEISESLKRGKEVVGGGSPSEKMVLFLRDSGSNCPRRWFYLTKIFSSFTLYTI